MYSEHVKRVRRAEDAMIKESVFIYGYEDVHFIT